MKILYTKIVLFSRKMIYFYYKYIISIENRKVVIYNNIGITILHNDNRMVGGKKFEKYNTKERK